MNNETLSATFDATVNRLDRKVPIYFLRLSNEYDHAAEFILSADFDALELVNKMRQAFIDYERTGGRREYLRLHIGKSSKFYVSEEISWFNAGYSEGRFIGYHPDFIKNKIEVFEKLMETIVRSRNALGDFEKFLTGVGDSICRQI